MKLFNGEEVDSFAYKIGMDAFSRQIDYNNYNQLNPFNHKSNKYFSWLKGYEDAINIVEAYKKINNNRIKQIKNGKTH